MSKRRGMSYYSEKYRRKARLTYKKEKRREESTRPSHKKYNEEDIRYNPRDYYDYCDGNYGRDDSYGDVEY